LEESQAVDEEGMSLLVSYLILSADASTDPIRYMILGQENLYVSITLLLTKFLANIILPQCFDEEQAAFLLKARGNPLHLMCQSWVDEVSKCGADPPMEEGGIEDREK
jgi:hypothetical protein